MTFLKYTLHLLVLLTSLILFHSCGGGTEYETVEIPTKGLITTVVEMNPEAYKIEDEVAVEDPADSRIIAKHLDGQTDTFTLEEARLIQQSGYSGNRSGLFTAASYGLFGYMMGRSLGNFRPSSNAYVNTSTHNRVNSTAGNQIRSTANVTRRAKAPSANRSSGYGKSSGGSSRSYGG